jgi:hypothetical protein
MAKNKVILICLLWVFTILPTNSLVSNDGYCVKLTAGSFIGIVEKGGNNKGFTDPYFRKLMEKQGWRPGYAWCSFFVMGVLDECNVPHTITGWSPTAYNRKDVIFTNGKFVQSYSPNDVLVMTLSYGDKNNKARYKGIGHTGIVELVGKYSVRTVEGNTNDRGTRDSRTGDGVYRKVRPLSRNLHITRWKKA